MKPKSIEDNREDMYWMINGEKYVIQGVSNFDIDQELPLGLKIDEIGKAKIDIVALENLDEDIKLYIKDLTNGETYPINDQSFEIDLEFDDKVYDFDVLKNIVTNAAAYGGFGDFRPTFGRAKAEVELVD